MLNETGVDAVTHGPEVFERRHRRTVDDEGTGLAVHPDDAAILVFDQVRHIGDQVVNGQSDRGQQLVDIEVGGQRMVLCIQWTPYDKKWTIQTAYMHGYGTQLK